MRHHDQVDDMDSVCLHMATTAHSANRTAVGQVERSTLRTPPH
jgi:hypothetical protein